MYRFSTVALQSYVKVVILHLQRQTHHGGHGGKHETDGKEPERCYTTYAIGKFMTRQCIEKIAKVSDDKNMIANLAIEGKSASNEKCRLKKS